MTVHVSLCIITLNAGKSIRACLDSMKQYVEEVCVLDTGSTDNTLEEVAAACPDAKVQVYIDPNRHPVHGWTSDFADLRNRNAAMASHDVILWLDADDVVVNPRNLRAAINDAFGGKFGAVASVLPVLYVYAQDDAGNWTSVVPRPRAYDRRFFDWEGVVHEDTRPLRPCKNMPMLDPEIAHVVHVRKDPRSRGSAERNLWILEQYQKRGRPMNDRLWQNVATSLNILGRYEEACAAFQRAIDAPHNNPECDYITFLRWGEACIRMRRYDVALEKFGRAQALFPDRKAPYLAMAETCMYQQQAKQALVYVEIASHMDADSEGFAWQPTNDKIAPAIIRAEAYMVLSEYERASAEYEALAKVMPNEEKITRPRDLLREMLGNHKLYASFMDLYRAFEASPADRAALVAMAPRCLHSFPEIAKLRIPQRPEGKRTIAIYCGNAQAPWGWDSVERGIGGSEEAVILLSRELAKQGWHVEVYAFPGTDQMGTDPHGVVWTPYYTWDENRPVDVFVGWRQFMACPKAVASLKVLWLHDSIIREYFTEEMVAGWDAILTVSKHHGEALPDHAKAKWVVSANGLSPDFFVDGPNRPTEFLYASSPDRGLETLLKLWPAIRKEVPEATLDVYYGFTRNFMAEASRNSELRRLRESVTALLEQPGVYMHGMVGQRQLSHAYARCGFTLYPTAWSETSCISMMRAQAMGCIPITSRHKDSALAETCGKFDLGPPVRDGSIYDQPEWQAEWVASVVAATRGDWTAHRQAMKAHARKEFSWQTVATQWSALFSERLSAPPRLPEPIPA